MDAGVAAERSRILFSVMANRPRHPYTTYERTLTWRRIDKAIADLEKNGDVSLTTSRPHVIGYLCQALNRARSAEGGRSDRQRTSRR